MSYDVEFNKKTGRYRAAFGRNQSPWWNPDGRLVTLVQDLMTWDEIKKAIDPPIIETRRQYLSRDGRDLKAWLDEILNSDVDLKRALREFDANLISATGFQDSVARYSNGEIVTLGAMTDRWKEYQFDDFYHCAEPYAKEFDAVFDAGGVLEGGKAFWLLAHIPDYFEEIEGDPYERNVLFYTRNDGKGSFIVKPTSTRVVCRNTADMALGGDYETGGGKSIALRHTGDTEAKLEGARKTIEEAWESYKEGEQTFLDMLDVELEPIEMASVLLSGIGIDVKKIQTGETQPSTRLLNIIDTLGRVATSGDGIKHTPEQRGTLKHAFDSVVEYVDHHRTIRGNGGNRLNATLFGTGAQMKRKAFQTAKQIVEADGKVSEVIEYSEGAGSPEMEEFGELLLKPTKGIGRSKARLSR